MFLGGSSERFQAKYLPNAILCFGPVLEPLNTDRSVQIFKLNNLKVILK